jgi:hypothetical protein
MWFYKNYMAFAKMNTTGEKTTRDDKTNERWKGATMIQGKKHLVRVSNGWAKLVSPHYN